MNIQDTILVIDDMPNNLRILDLLLTDAGYQTRLIPSGQLALTSIKNEIPDLILLDIRMPGMDGFEVCNKIKEIPGCESVPIIFISALSETEDKVKAFKSGGVDYIIKPFQTEEVLARVRTHLKIHKLQNSLELKNHDLETAIEKIKTLSGLLPICSNCKKIRDDSGYWEQIESYIGTHSEAEFSHSICPECIRELYPDLVDELEADNSENVSEINPAA